MASVTRSASEAEIAAAAAAAAYTASQFTQSPEKIAACVQDAILHIKLLKSRPSIDFSSTPLPIALYDTHTDKDYDSKCSNIGSDKSNISTAEHCSNVESDNFIVSKAEHCSNGGSEESTVSKGECSEARWRILSLLSNTDHRSNAPSKETSIPKGVGDVTASTAGTQAHSFDTFRSSTEFLRWTRSHPAGAAFAAADQASAGAAIGRPAVGASSAPSWVISAGGAPSRHAPQADDGEPLSAGGRDHGLHGSNSRHPQSPLPQHSVAPTAAMAAASLPQSPPPYDPPPAAAADSNQRRRGGSRVQSYHPEVRRNPVGAVGARVSERAHGYQPSKDRCSQIPWANDESAASGQHGSPLIVDGTKSMKHEDVKEGCHKEPAGAPEEGRTPSRKGAPVRNQRRSFNWEPSIASLSERTIQGSENQFQPRLS